MFEWDQQLQRLELLSEWWQVQLLFADGATLVADSEEKLCGLVSEFSRVCKRMKLSDCR